MPSNQSELTTLMELASRRVRTLAGAKLYGQPIGTVIGEGPGDAPTEERPVTEVRLRSLQAQFLAAKRTGNTAIMADIQKEFSVAFRKFAETHQAASVLSDLQSESGNNEQAIQES